MQQNLKSIGNIDVKVNPRLSHFRSPDKIALVQYESTQRKMQKSQKAWNWLGMLTRKWNINYPTFNHLHSHSLKATWIRWEKKEIQNLIDLKCWNIDYPTFDLRLDQADKTAFFLSGTRSSINVYQQTSHRGQFPKKTQLPKWKLFLWSRIWSHLIISMGNWDVQHS